MSITVRDKEKIIASLNTSLELAISQDNIQLPEEIELFLNNIFQNIDTATSGYLNLITCLICASVDSSIDPRFHRKPGKGMPTPENMEGWFSGRTVSEKIIYPWMEIKGFRTAKSGWQTRTYERPKPYTLDYPENISFIKEPFLQVLNYASNTKDKYISLVAFLFRKEIQFNKEKVALAKNISKNMLGNEVLIIDIIDALEQHFVSPNSAHLPVIAIYSIYQLLIDEVENYSGLRLRNLESHQASDLRTGAIGDIELEDFEREVIEGAEVKHGIDIDLPILLKAKEKILKSKLKRYYILTTHKNCSVLNEETLAIIRQIYKNHGCQVIVNGVVPTIKYYLRMCTNPSVFINNYSINLTQQSSVTAEQLKVWERLQGQLDK